MLQDLLTEIQPGTWAAFRIPQLHNMEEETITLAEQYRDLPEAQKTTEKARLMRQSIRMRTQAMASAKL